MSANDVAERWSFLEEEPEPCGVFSSKMEVLYLNAGARTLVPKDWFGRQCWKVFPVADQACASACPAVQAARNGGEVFSCTEQVIVGGGTITLGVAVMPLRDEHPDDERLAVLFRPEPEALSDDPTSKAAAEFTEALTRRGVELLESIESHLR